MLWKIHRTKRKVHHQDKSGASIKSPKFVDRKLSHVKFILRFFYVIGFCGIVALLSYFTIPFIRERLAYFIIIMFTYPSCCVIVTRALFWPKRNVRQSVSKTRVTPHCQQSSVRSSLASANKE